MLQAETIKTMLFAILCICFIFYLFLGIDSYKRDNKSKVNAIFFAVCIADSLMAIGSAFMLISPNIEIANIWSIVASLGGCFVSGLCTSFILSLKNKNMNLKNSNIKIQFLIYIASIIFFINGLVYQPKLVSSEAYGFISVSYATTTIGIIFSIYTAVLFIAGMVIICFQMMNSQKNRVRKQMKIILIVSLITFCLAAATNFIFPLLGIVAFPSGIIVTSIAMGGMWYAINKYKMMSISYELVSEYLFETVNEPIFILGEDFLVKNCNEASVNITGYNRNDLEQNSLDVIINFRNFNFNTIIQAKNAINIEIDLHRENKGTLVCELSSTVIYDEYKDILGILVLLHDVSERKKIAEIQEKYTLKLQKSNINLEKEITDRKYAEDQIRHFVYYDTLTEIFNRKKMLEDINVLLNDKNERFAILFIDLDKFKSANDNYGHEAGDYILKTVAVRLKNIIRSTNEVYRIGGDEFIIILRNLKVFANVEKIAVDVLKILSAAFIYKENQLFVGACVGISIFSEHGIDADTLIKKADSAMYEVKRKGGNGYKIYSTVIKENNLN